MFRNKKFVNILISAVLAFLFINFFMKGKEDAIDESLQPVEVLAAARDIPPHTRLSSMYVTTRRIPRKFLEPKAILAGADDVLKRIQNKVTVAALPTDAQLTETMLKEPSVADTGIAPLLPRNKRGYILRLTNLDVGKLIQPDDFLDVLATFKLQQGQHASKVTQTILQNVRVISVGALLRKNTEATAKDQKQEGLVLSLALDPLEAQKMWLAESEAQGEIRVSVRGHGDTHITPSQGLTPSGLLH